MNHQPLFISRTLWFMIPLTLLVSCGGGESKPATQPATQPATKPTASKPKSPLTIKEFLFAQTHVIPPTGLSWKLQASNASLHLVGRRDALAIVDMTPNTPINPRLSIWFNKQQQASIALNPATSFPPTEAGGTAFRNNSYTAIIPAVYVKKGLVIKVLSDNYTTSASIGAIQIGVDADLDLKLLPFYVYGAAPNIKGSPPLAQSQKPDVATIAEIYAKWPVATLNVKTHGAGLIQWSYMIIEPRGNHAAYRAKSKNDQINGFDTMSAVLNVLSALRTANGDKNTANQYYAPLMMADVYGNYQPPGGGLGGGNIATGDHRYAGIFIHEIGHGFGLPHQGTAYTSGKYPYIGGSLLGSSWGFDQNKQAFLAPFLPSTASSYNNCLTSKSFIRQTDAQGRCVKQDPMQSGDRDKAATDKFGTFSDFSTAQMQGHLRKNIYIDPYATSGYSRWDTKSSSRVNIPSSTTKKGLYGLDNNFPIQTQVPVHTIIITYSHVPCTPLGVGTCNASGVNTAISQIYPPITYTGNLRRVVDPSKPSDLTSIIPNTGTYPWYCQNSGCDYSVRVTYVDGTTWLAVLQTAFRPWFKATAIPAATTNDPLNKKSFKVWGVNAPGNKRIFKIELLDTAMVWNGFPTNPTVLMSR
ncbi:MAG: peptidase M66 [Zetaproteobacteria bacterium]|nr:peptidase M66 [Zetaproteobacteria bacterium]